MRTCFSTIVALVIFSVSLVMGNDRAQLQALPPEITGIKPLQNALAIYKTANVIVTFNTAMNAATLNNSTIKVHGSQSGLHTSSSITYGSSAKTLRFNPDVDFKFGEVVTVTLTTGIASAGGAALSIPFTWRFTVDVADSEGDFVKTSETSSTLADRMAAGDFDADGDLDLAVTNGEVNTVSILKNDGSGAFGSGVTLPVAYRPNSVSIGDFDSDGDLDLVVPSSNYQGLGEATIFKNDGGGNFTSSSSPTVGYHPFFASVGDYDGDGDLDLAVSMNGSGGVANSGTAILMNDGSGAFTINSTIDAPGCEFPLTSGDWDSDGDLDLAVPSHCSFGLSIFQNNGSGVFTLTATVSAGSYPSMVAAGDLDSDGDLDLVVPNRNDASSSPSTVTILKNDGSGNFVNTSSPSITGTNPQSLDLGDFDNDNDLDIVVVNGPFSSVSILLNDGLGTFTNSAQPETGNSVNWVLTADFDKDGDLDLAVSCGASNNLTILKKVQAPIYPSVTSPQTAGSEFWVYVKVGNNNNPVANLFGVSFVLNFTHTDYLDVVAPVSNNVLKGAFLGSDVVLQQSVDEASGKVSVGISRKQGQAGVNGSGIVARVKFLVRSNLPANDTLITFSISEVNAIAPTRTPLALLPLSKQVTINTINNLDSVTVWPGDTNNDAIVNQNDVLPLGQFWSLSGPARANATMDWAGQSSASWTTLKATYADATGDGKIDQADALPLGVNWGNTHATAAALASAKDSESEIIASGAMIQPEALPNELAPNQEFSIKIKVAEVEELFGLAFELVSDRAKRLQILAVSPQAFLGDDVVFVSNIDTTSGKVAVSLSRKAGQGGVKGNGVVVRVKAKISPAAVAGEKIRLTLQNVAASGVNGAPLAINAQAANLIVKGSTAVEERENSSVPSVYALAQNFPNPFNPSTKISFALPQAGEVSLRIYNETGQLVRTLVKRAMNAGAHELHWNGCNQSNEQVVAGVYLYQIAVTNDRGEVVFSETKRMTLLK